MSSVCTDQQHHKFHSSHQLFSPTTKKTLLRHIDIPPRKLLLSRRSMNLENSDGFSTESAKISSADETLLKKFFLENPGAISGGGGGGEAFTETDDDPYSSDHFRMYEFKIRRCTRSRSHDWTDCPFAHPGEKARRRDPRRHQYSGTVCPDYRRGGCSHGENCQFAHGVFESWLHPARYRTEACKDGKHCKRKVCFFAHTPRQLRILPPNFSAGCGGGGERCCPVLPDRTVESNLSPNSNSSNPSNHCCAYCHVFTNSPTSTLMGVPQFSPPMSPSPPLSPVKCHPPLSPVKCHPISKYLPFSRYSDRLMMNCEPSDLNNKFNVGGGMLSYKDAFTELMSSLEAMNVQEKASHAGTNNGNVTCFNSGEDQNQIILSPSGPNLSGSGRDFVNGGCNSRKSENIPFSIDDNNGWSCPDLGWVNELLK